MKKYFLLLIASCLVFSCKKDETPIDEVSIAQLQSAALTDFANKIALTTYRELDLKMEALNNAAITFHAQSTPANLELARTAWQDVRAVWEQSESFLFGPVSTENIDPGTDTWPVDFQSLDSLLATTNPFDQSYIQTLGDELKGYHPTEYLLWGNNGNKTAADFTVREKEFLIALTADLRMKASSLKNFWEPSNPDNFHAHIVNAGTPASVYGSKRAVFEEMISSMIGICDEVANGKILEPFAAQDPSLEESPFSNNSLTDFKNNMLGVRNVYTCSFREDGTGIEDLVKKNNLSLNASIHAKINNALISFNAITVPFGQAIISQRSQVQNTIDQINALKLTLEEELLPYIRTVAD